jgi:hypothetical protein
MDMELHSAPPLPLSEATRAWLHGGEGEPDPINAFMEQLGLFLVNSRCKCGARFATDLAARNHSLSRKCDDVQIEYQQNDRTWR